MITVCLGESVKHLIEQTLVLVAGVKRPWSCICSVKLIFHLSSAKIL